MPVPLYDDAAGAAPPPAWLAQAAGLPPPPLPDGTAPGGGGSPPVGPDVPPAQAPIPPPTPGFDVGMGTPAAIAAAAPGAVPPGAPAIAPPPIPGFDAGLGTPAAQAFDPVVPTAVPQLGPGAGLSLGAPPPGLPVGGSAPDAVSDAAAPAIAPTPATPDPYADHPWDNPDTAARDRAAMQLALHDPAKFTLFVSHLAEQKARAESTARRRIEDENLNKQLQNVEDQKRANAATQAKSDQILRDAEVLANKAPDKNHWFSGLSFIGKLGAIASIIIGGARSQYTGGRNTGLDWVDQQIKDDVAQQAAQITAKRDVLGMRTNAVAQEFKRTGDLYQAQETVRQAMYTAAINKLATAQQDFDPRGTSFARSGAAIQQLAAAQQQSIDAHNKEQHARAMAEFKEAREMRAQVETARHNRAQEGVEYGKLAIERNKAAVENQLLSPQEIHAQYPELPVTAIPPTGMTRKQLGQHVETYNKTQETANKQFDNSQQHNATEVVGADGKPLVVDGKPVRAPSAKVAEDLNMKITGAQNMVTFLGDVRRVLESDPSSVSREQWAAATTAIEDAKFAYAKIHGVNATSRELEAMHDLFGANYTDYANRVKDKGTGIAHIDTLVRDAKTTVRNELRAVKYNGPDVLIDTTTPKPVAETPDDKAIKGLLVDQITALGQYKHDGRHFEDEGPDPAPSAAGITPLQQRTLNKLQADIAGPDHDTRLRWVHDLARPEGDTFRARAEKEQAEAVRRHDAALEALQRVSASAEIPGVRKVAGDILQSVVTGDDIPSTPEVVR